MYVFEWLDESLCVVRWMNVCGGWTVMPVEMNECLDGWMNEWMDM